MRSVIVVVLPVFLIACDTEPLDRPGTLRATGVNQANLQAMLVEPDHLQRGIGAEGSHGATGADAVERLLAGKRHPLPETVIVDSGK